MKDIVQNMNMKTTIVKVLTCMLLTVAAVANVNAANGIIEEKNYKICPGDTIMVDKRDDADELTFTVKAHQEEEQMAETV